MATNNKIVREVVATTEQEKSTATFNGWNLNFTTNRDGNVVKNINVHGTKEGQTVSGILSENGAITIGFSSVYDASLAGAIADEFAAMTSQEQ